MSVRSSSNRRIWSAWPACLALCALAAVGCSTDFGPNEARAVENVRIVKGAAAREKQGFSPNPVTVVTKTQVVWTNNDTTEHRIASFAGLFQGNVIKPGETYSYIFQAPASYAYRCLVPGHTESGVINVTP